MDVTVYSDGRAFSVPEELARTESQLRWLQQTSFSGCADEVQITIDDWNLYNKYSADIVYRSTTEVIKDFLGTWFCKSFGFRMFVARIAPKQWDKIHHWGCIVRALRGKQLRWKIL